MTTPTTQTTFNDEVSSRAVAASADTSDSKVTTWRCSMTRANKLLARLRTSSDITPKSKIFSKGPLAIWYYHQINLLNYTGMDNLTKDLAKAQNKIYSHISKQKLIARWKDRIFELNVKYGIHTLLSKIDLLQKEKSILSDIVNSMHSTNWVHVDTARNIEKVGTSDKKYDLQWNVAVFDAGSLEEKIRAISAEISELDDLKDRLNAASEFSLDLSKEDFELLSL